MNKHLIRTIKFLTCNLSKSTLIPFIIYIIFITTILSLTFPNGIPTKSINLVSLEDTSSESGGELNRNSESRFEPQILGEHSTPKQVLNFAFRKADLNADGLLNIKELAKYINLRIRDHIDTSIKKNPLIFAEIDKAPQDGLVSWNEYHNYFLKNLKLDENYIKNHDEKKHVKLNRRAKEDLMRDKARWGEVLSSDPYSLTVDEFLHFLHPEASTSNLLNLIEDILKHFDADGDDQLTVEEFTNTYSSTTDNKKLFLSDNLEERRAEFKKLIDKNHDGKADRTELLHFVDPRNSRYAIQEAAMLINLADSDNDKRLSLDEIITKQDLFMGSKFISLIENFHNEF